MNNLETYINQGNSKQLLTQNGFNDEERKKITQRIITLVSGNYQLEKLDPKSIFMVALKMESMGLSPELETGYIVPYGNQAQFQIGVKGLQQLAMNTGYYVKIECVPVKESDFVEYDIDTDTYTWSKEKLTFAQTIERNKEATIGYRAFAVHINGMKEELFWDMDKIDAHHQKFSQAYKTRNSGKPSDKYNIYNTSKDAMDRKCVLKMFISRNLIKTMDTSKSDALREALKLDQAVYVKNQFEYDDRETRSEAQIGMEEAEVKHKERVKADADKRYEVKKEGKPTSKQTERLTEYQENGKLDEFIEKFETIDGMNFGRASELIQLVKDKENSMVNPDGTRKVE